jgi:hypothetical protein
MTMLGWNRKLCGCHGGHVDCAGLALNGVTSRMGLVQSGRKQDLFIKKKASPTITLAKAKAAPSSGLTLRRRQRRRNSSARLMVVHNLLDRRRLRGLWHFREAVGTPSGQLSSWGDSRVSRRATSNDLLAIVERRAAPRQEPTLGSGLTADLHSTPTLARLELPCALTLRLIGCANASGRRCSSPEGVRVSAGRRGADSPSFALESETCPVRQGWGLRPTADLSKVAEESRPCKNSAAAPARSDVGAARLRSSSPP